MQTTLPGSTGARRRTSVSRNVREVSVHESQGAAEISRTFSPSTMPSVGLEGADEERAGGRKRQNFISDLAHVMVRMRNVRFSGSPNTRRDPCDGSEDHIHDRAQGKDLDGGVARCESPEMDVEQAVGKRENAPSYKAGGQ